MQKKRSVQFMLFAVACNVLIVLLASVALHAQTADSLPEPDITITNVWARPAIQGGNSAIYFIITNNSDKDIVLTGATSDVSKIVEVHETTLEKDEQTGNEIMHMHEVPEIVLEAKSTLYFQPSGLHVMLIDLHDALRLDERIQFTLNFADHQSVTAEAVVRISGD